MTASQAPSAPVVSALALAAALGQFPPTPAQRRVIEAPLGPALVVAGAGSGKTETMAGRVVWLVANGLVRRDEVLGLTFTRKAAGELAERIARRLARLAEFERRGLLSALEELYANGALAPFAQIERSGDESARAALLDELSPLATPAPESADALLERPVIATYNGFADAIVRENAARIGRDPESAILSESAAWLLMRRIVLDSDDERLEHREEALRTIIDAALRIARDGTDNLADPDAVDAFAARFARVRELPSENKRTTVYRDVETAAGAVAGLPILTGLARRYDEAKRRRGVIDFSDQVAGALRIVSEHPDVAAHVRGQYRVVLLDEYQDTSVVQTRLLAGLFADGAVMAVGDPHQAIYGWRGASAGNLGGFAAAFAPATRCSSFELLTSWRNSSRVLDAAAAVLAPLAPRAAVPVGRLEPRPDAAAGDVEVAWESDVEAEADRVARWFAGVRTDRARHGQSTTGALLLRSKKHMARFGDALGRRGIPHRILGLGGLLSTPEVVDIVSALRVVVDPDAGSALIRLLSGPRWGVGLADLAGLRALAGRLATHDAALRPLPDPVRERSADAGSLVDALDFLARTRDDHGWLAHLTPVGRERLREAGGVFAGLRQAADMPIPELVRVIESELRLDIELAANEARGPARIASAQVRAFIDEIHAFLAADETGTLTSLLAWLDHAEQLDEFAPRTEPPEPDVVQLLTIHGSKGLEWDAVAVVRLVEDELPTKPKSKWAWLKFGELPYGFRPDAPWLPHLDWDGAQTQQELKAAMDRFSIEVKERQREEERRLAYVAVTRARDHLLLSGSPWAGTKAPRDPSAFLVEMADALALPLPESDPGENPFAGERRFLQWPLDPLGARRGAVMDAAELVRAAREAPRAAPTRDLALLLAERDAAGSAPQAPVRIPASRYKDFVVDLQAAVAATARPLPERPYAQTQLGTRFHEWVERRSGLIAGGGIDAEDGLFEGDELEVSGDEPGALADLIARFEASEWARRVPIEVESEIDFRFTAVDGREHVAICKLDAVYRGADGRIEIVDWKTGAPPRTAADREARLVQVDMYRRAYHARHGVPLDEIDVILVYIAHDVTIRG